MSEDSQLSRGAEPLEAIIALLSKEGYAVDRAGDQLLRVREPSSGFQLTCALERNILFNTLVCLALPVEKVDLNLTRRMLAADNGISTSSFQLIQRPDNTVMITLNNFCVLQDLGPEDEDDILSCLAFLAADSLAARELLRKAPERET